MSNIFDGATMPTHFESWKIFPCRAKTIKWTDRETGEEMVSKAKKALVPWKAAATNDQKQIEEWALKFPRCMWAAATGKASGFWVLDLDRGHGDVDGVEVFKAYCAEHGQAFPKTLMQRTPSGGIHLFFKAPAGVEIITKAGILPGVDVRGDGGYVIIAPSVNQDNGGRYEWI